MHHQDDPLGLKEAMRRVGEWKPTPGVRMAPPTLKEALKDVERDRRMAQLQPIPVVPMPGVIKVFLLVVGLLLVGGVAWVISKLV
jgi:hypothetical protein